MALSDEQAMALSEEEVKQWPNKIAIGTTTAWERCDFYTYTKVQVGREPVYLCDRESGYGRRGEFLMLRCEKFQDGVLMWTAYDTLLQKDQDGSSTVWCRQAVFRCVGKDITKPGIYEWQMNQNAGRNNVEQSVRWYGNLRAETKAVL